MRRFATLTVFFSAFVLSGTVSVRAQATRTWVSGVGDDANPCSRTAPCKTFAGAISKTAAKGEINVLDPGGFGAVTITKAISIDGGSFISGVLVSGTNGIVIQAGASDTIQLRNLDINGLGAGLSGLNILAAGNVQVENVHIYGFTNFGINFAPNQAANSSLLVKNSVITDNLNYGIFIAPVGGGHATADIIGVTASRNKAGLRVQDNATVEVVESVFSHNLNAGVAAVATSGAAALNVKNSVSASNQFGVASNNAPSVVSLSNVSVFGNTATGLSASGGSLVSFGNNQIFNNPVNGSPTQTIPQQ
ncbi:right-handed parallel beta-helix repeat-containing protein [Methylocystis sp. JAN1]|uniref:right-handed parallel beta-helix repeat-containing protein n=1 Tax=Methylocystis sp. JAN1 TaxID=3397211 RepID=UPI003FA20104